MTAQQSPAPELAHLFAIATEFQSLAPWKTFSDTPMIAHVDPVTNLTVYCSILGANEEVFGLAMYPGDAGLQSLLRMLVPVDNAPPDTEAGMLQTAWLLSFDVRRELMVEDKALLKAAGVRMQKGVRRFPTFHSHEPAWLPQTCTAQECRQITDVLACVNRFVRDAHNDPSLITTLENFERKSGRTRFPIYVPAPADHGAPWVIRWIDATTARDEPSFPPFEICATDVQRLRVQCPPTADCWQLGTFLLPTPVKERSGGRLFFPRVLLITDAARPFVFHSQLHTPHDNVSHAIGSEFIAALQTNQHRPTTLQVANKSHADILRPLCAALDIQVKIAAELPSLEDAKNSLINDAMMRDLQMQAQDGLGSGMMQ